MDINLVKESIVIGASNAAETIKEAVLWLGRTICEGFSALGELIAKCWDSVSTFACESATTIAHFTHEHVFPCIQDASISTFTFLRTPAGMAFVASGTGVGLAIAGDLCDTSTVTRGQAVRNNPYFTTALRVGAFVSFFAAGVSIGYGAVNGLNTPLI